MHFREPKHVLKSFYKNHVSKMIPQAKPNIIAEVTDAIMKTTHL